MFIRKDKKASGIYLSICKTYRTSDNKVKQELVRSLGKLSDYKAEELRQLACSLYKLGGGLPQDLSASPFHELGRYNYGFPYILHRLLLAYGLDSVFHRLQRRHRLSYDLLPIYLLLLCDRFQDPISKLASYDYQDEYVGLPGVKLHHIYRALDKLGQHKDVIKQHLYQQHYRIQQHSCDLVFYDVTTFYFDSQVEGEGQLRQKGFSKDGKMGKTQVVFGLLIDSQKNPISYEVYAGNQYEGHTMANILQAIKRQYHIKKVVVVADRGMMNKSNVALFNADAALADFEYVIGERLKRMPKEVRTYLTNLSNYTSHQIDNEDGQRVLIQYCTYRYEDKTIIGTYSTKRAKKDRLEREAKIKKGQRMPTSELQKKAKLYYLKAKNEQQFVLDQKRIDKAKQFDGFMAIATSDHTLKPLQIIDHYKHLYQIEQSFRTFKSYLEIRPMFHWTDKRIQGHICLCYMAYCLLNYLQQQLKAQQLPHSERAIRRCVANMQVSEVKMGEQHYYMRSAMNKDTEQLLQILKLNKLPDFMPKRKLRRYFAQICTDKIKKLKCSQKLKKL